MLSVLARKVIRAVQSSMLDLLIVRLWPLFIFFQSLGPAGHVPGYAVIVASIWATMAVLTFLIWFLGYLAVHNIRKGQLVFERIQGAPTNGFDVWLDPPMSGLSTPNLLARSMVFLGAYSDHKTAWRNMPTIIVYLVISCFAFVVLVFPEYAASMSPILNSESARRFTFWGSFTSIAAISLRMWATEGRRRLDGAPMRRQPFQKLISAS